MHRNEPQFLWVPNPSKVLSHGMWIDDIFPKPYPIHVTIHAEGENLLEEAQEGIRRTFTLIDTVRNTTGYDDACKEAILFMMESDMDSVYSETCYIDSLIKFWDYSIDTFTTNVTSDG